MADSPKKPSIFKIRQHRPKAKPGTSDFTAHSATPSGVEIIWFMTGGRDGFKIDLILCRDWRDEPGYEHVSPSELG